MKIIITICFFLFLSDLSLANRITGTVTDSSNDDLLIGAHLVFTNQATNRNHATVTGLDGRYSINNLAPGEYRITVTFVGFLPASRMITVQEGQNQVVDFILDPDEQTLSEIVVFGDQRGSDAHARALERRSVTVTNIVSARQIQLSPDITVANVIQRVSGLSIERNSSGDPQYAIIRGMDKRYNNTLVNGIKNSFTR
jgi:hypothetical protein